jgi:hypothetical protein
MIEETKRQVTSKANHSTLLIALQDLERWLENRDMMESANTCRKAVKALLGDTHETPEPPYYVRSYWSPSRQYLVTAHATPEGIISLQDDNGREWEPSGPQQNMADGSSTKAECGLCAEGMNSFTDPDTGKKMHARNGVVTVCTAENGLPQHKGE